MIRVLLAFLTLSAALGCSTSPCRRCLDEDERFLDQDGDGFGDPSSPFTCDRPCPIHPTVEKGAATDCDDADPTVHKGATESPGNTVDEDCDGFLDCAVDADRDGFVLRARVPVGTPCDSVSHGIDAQIDCDDQDPAVGDTQARFVDADLDGFGAAPAEPGCAEPGLPARAGDCDDADAAVFPTAGEACDQRDNDCDDLVDLRDPDYLGPQGFVDADGDGYGFGAAVGCPDAPGLAPSPGDCDDLDPSVYPSAPESCAAPDRDLNCDDVSARAQPQLAPDAVLLHADRDRDGFGAAAATLVCAGPGWVTDHSDCDDQQAGVRPGAEERCDERDEDCDGLIDEDVGPGAPLWWPDLDGDGFGAGQAVRACARPSGHVDAALDCDDGRPEVYPAAPEACDDPSTDRDCDGVVAADDRSADAAVPRFVDADGDGFGAEPAEPGCPTPGLVARGGDCDDRVPTVHPEATERCNGLDDDCDALADGDDPSLDGDLLLLRDADGDGYGAGDAVPRCAWAPGWATIAGDCDDLNPLRAPNQPERCAAITLDADCDGVPALEQPDRIVDREVLRPDADHDGFGARTPALLQCPGEGWSANADDCDDASPGVSPAAEETCDEVDEDCDGAVDEDPRDGLPWFRDADADGYGAGLPRGACSAPVGFVALHGDCDDGRADVAPAAPETCADPNTDHDCDGIPAALDPSNPQHTRRFTDEDGDGFGGEDLGRGCPAPEHAEVGGDCDDLRAAVNPGALEVCDGDDNDCDGAIDANDASVDNPAFAWIDGDGDGFGAGAPQPVCAGARPGLADRDGDCDDADPTRSPDAPEDCGPVDRDCDGDAYDAGEETLSTWYADGDGDGVGGGAPIRACGPPGGAVAAAGDCDDRDPGVLPGADEVCDGLDNDCDGAIDDEAAPEDPGAAVFHPDADADGHGATGPGTWACLGEAPAGYVRSNDDCDDIDPMTSPSAPERCNGVDDDCDGAADADDPDLRDGAPERSWLADGDGDGAGDPTATFFGCAPPPGFILAATSTGDDCDDADPTRHPVAHERCDDVDQDCDGLAWRDDTVGFLPTGAQVVEDLTAEVHGPVLDPTLTLDGGVLHVCGDVLTVLSVVATAELEVVGHATHGRARVRAVDRGVWLRSASDLTLRGLEVVDSGRRDVGDGQAAVDHAPSRMVALRIADCGFRNNGDGLPTPGLGGAVATRARQVDVSDSAFTGNLAATGAGLRHLDMPAESTVRVTDTAFEQNLAADGCGAVHIDGAETVTLVGVSLISNQTDLGAGGGGCIRTPAGGAVHIEDPEIVSNIGELVGGLDVESGTIHVFGSEPVREEPPPARLVVGGDNPCDIDRDTGTAPTEIDGTGRAEVRDNAARTVDEALEDAAGGLRLRANVVEIEDVALEGNEIFTLGGAAMWIGPQEVPAVALLRRLRVADNETSASRSSITAAVRISTDVTLSLYRSEFVSNRAFGSGAAALQVDEDTRIHRTSFHANQATPRGVNSATIRYRSEGTLTLTDSAFTDNTGGAALAIKLNGGLRVHGTSFVHNTSSVGAGAIEFVKDSLSPNDISTTGTTCLQHARFVSNTTTLGGGAIHLPGTDAGLDAADIGGELEAFASVFDNNEADGPGASIFLEGNVTAALYGATFTNTPNGAAAIAVHSTERGPARLDLDGTCGFDDPTHAIQTADVDASAPIAYPYASLPVSCTSDLGCGL